MLKSIGHASFEEIAFIEPFNSPIATRGQDSRRNRHDTVSNSHAALVV